jgi:DNA-binding transcriptional ArsR family regulator
MTKNYLIQITLNVYQISEWWPESVFLRFKVRNLANEILSDFILLSRQQRPDADVYKNILENVENIKEAWAEARTQKLIDRENFLIFQKEYGKLSQALNSLSFPKKAARTELSVKKSGKRENKLLNERQKKILSILKKKNRAQVWELKEIIGKVTKRTLRRDLDVLLKNKLVQRIGEWNEVFYKLSTEN